MMQIIAYLRHIEQLPANVETILQSLNNAITFKVFIAKGLEWWNNFRGIENESENEEEEELENVGIEEDNLFWSFGLYAKFFICLVLLFGIYYLVNFMLRRFPGLRPVESFLHKKLYYSAVIRFTI